MGQNSVFSRLGSLMNTAYYLSNDFMVGNTQEEKVLFHIIKYYQVFVVFLKRIITYYSVPFIPTS